MIDYIELDKKRPIKFGMNALRLWTKDIGISLHGINMWIKDPDIDGTIKLLYYGLKDGARYVDKSFDLTFEQVCDLTDDMDKIVKGFDLFLGQYSDGSGGEDEKKVKESS